MHNHRNHRGGLLTDSSADILKLIQELSNERQTLWRTAGHRRLKPKQQERIRYLNDRIPQLWHDYRVSFSRPVKKTVKTVQKEWMIDFADSLTGRTGAPEANDVDDSPVGVDQLFKWQLVAELVREVLYEERHLDLTLKQVLARRGETLSWVSPKSGRGRTYPQRVPLHT